MVDPLYDPAWWRSLASSVARQVLHVVVPILVTVEAAAGRVDLSVTLLALAGAVLVTCVHGVLRGLSGVTSSGPGGRFVATAAGVLVGLVPQAADGMVGLGSDGWRAVVVAAFAGGLVSLAHYWADPPQPAGLVAVRG